MRDIDTTVRLPGSASHFYSAGASPREVMNDSGDRQSDKALSPAVFPLATALDCQPLSVAPETPLLEVITLMSQGGSPSSASPVKRSSYALVMAGEQLIGILTERDVVKLATQGIDLATTPVADVMTQRLMTLQEADLQHPFAALSVFRQCRIRHLPILNQSGQVLGVATPNSIRRTLKASDLFRLCRVEEVMSPSVINAPPEATVLELAQLMANHRVSCVVITQPGNSTTPPSLSPLGIVTERDIVQFQALGLSLSTLKAQAVMSTPLVCLSPQDTLWTANQTMARMRVRRLVVTDPQDSLIGIVTQTSILASLDPLEMQKTITYLQQQVENLQNEQMQWLQNHATQLESQIQNTEQRFQAIFNQTFQFIGLLEPDGTLIEANQTALDFGGLQREAVINRPFWEAHWWTIAPETQAQLKHAIARAAQGEFVRYEVDVLGVDQITTIDFSLRPILDAAGQVKLLIPEGRDISDRKRTEAALLQSEQRYANLAEAAPVGIFQTDADGNCLYVNHRWCQIAGMPFDAAKGMGWVQGIHPEDRETVAAEWYRAAQANQLFRLEYRFQTPTGEVTWVVGQAVAETDPDGQVRGYIGTISDITDRKQAELALQQLNQELEARVAQRTTELAASQELAQVTLHAIADAVITTDAFGRVEYFNPIAEQLTGWQAADAKGQLLTEVFSIVHEMTREPVENPVEQVLREGRVTDFTNHTVLLSRQGKEYSIEKSAAPIRDRTGQTIGTVIVFRDVTDSRQLARHLSWQASHDALTSLANRRQFEQDLLETLQSAHQGNHRHVLCYLDLDQFKLVNDTCGHAAGDELLRQVAQLIKSQIRSTDRLARLGGDEFGILLKQCPLQRAERLADQIRKAVQQFRFPWQDKTFRIGVSIGLVCLNTDSHTLAEALSAADAACYAAKDRGRNRIHTYRGDDTELAQQEGERRWSVRIRQALEDKRFCLYRQAIAPIADPDDACAHYEVLLRMIDEQGHLISPGRFIPAAERYDLMSDLDRWVVQTFLPYLEQAQPTDCSPERSPSVHFLNLSSASVGDAQFLDFLKAQFDQHAISPQHIGFEITETAAIANLDQATHFIRELKQLGCHFALDDFGSGLSSFAYLKTLPVDYLKISGEFVEDIAQDPATYAIVESINHVGHVMGLKTIAESVETLTLRETLGKIGVDYAQGAIIAQ
ncbi:MAG: EAL domain-containing protein, partial [Cyanobacteria bacterium P01_G01_bin.38]